MSRTTLRLAGCVLVLSLMLSSLPHNSLAEPLSDPDFSRTWAREDGPVASGAASRTWLWGPEPFTTELSEPYGSAPGGERTVQYFDKARMEINNPDAVRDRWYVTTGLLATELMTGGRQVSDEGVEQRGPALIPVAGDADDPDGPTYESFNRVRSHEPFNTGTTLTAVIDREGRAGVDQHFARYAVLAEHHVPETRHTVASVFWDYLNATGTVEEDGVQHFGRLFEPWFYATGLPVTEAYWSRVRVGGLERDVLIQVFERRVLTYTPANDPGWRVELGNVGRHYYAWRYERDSTVPDPSRDLLWTADLAALYPARADDGSWETGWDDVTRSYTIVNDPSDDLRGLRTVSRYWNDPAGGLPDNYRMSVEVQARGSGEAGIGVHVAGSGGTIASMVYVGIASNGSMTVTLEDNTNGSSRYLLLPASNLPGWDATDGTWNTLAVTVMDDRLWIEVGGIVAGEVELPAEAEGAGIALSVTSFGSDDDPAVYGFRNLVVESVDQP